MSSDNEKLRCLRVLSEVERYIWQDKRGPKDGVLAEILFLLQSIINAPAEKNRIAANGRQIVDDLVHKTATGNVGWYIQEICDIQTLIHDPQNGMKKFKVNISTPYKSWNDVGDLELSSHDMYHSLKIQLNELDKRFFFVLYENTKRDDRNALINCFLNI